MAEAAGERERFVVLDGLRGAAALAVITDHVPSTIGPLIPGRYLAVDFFFALSGFILAHVYGQRLAAGLPTFDFMRSRVVRLYPLYFAAIVFAVVQAFVKMAMGLLDLDWRAYGLSAVLNALYLPAPPIVVRDAPFPLNPPAWSLFFELVANLVFAVLATRLTRSVLAAVLAAGAAGVAWSAFTFGMLDGGYAFSNFIAGFPRVFYAFFAGVAVYRLRERWRAPALPWWATFILLAGILAFSVPASVRPAWDALSAILLFPLLIVFSADSKVRGAPARVCAWAGAVSYGFYVFQAPVHEGLIAILGPMPKPPGMERIALVTGLTLAIVLVLRRFYEGPARRFLSDHLYTGRGLPFRLSFKKE